MTDKHSPKKADGSGIAYARTEDPVELDSDNASQNSRLRTATALQSSVKPGDYPADERRQQVAAATGQPETKRRSDREGTPD